MGIDQRDSIALLLEMMRGPRSENAGTRHDDMVVHLAPHRFGH